jgi:hypothetical protein
MVATVAAMAVTTATATATATGDGGNDGDSGGDDGDGDSGGDSGRQKRTTRADTAPERNMATYELAAQHWAGYLERHGTDVLHMKDALASMSGVSLTASLQYLVSIRAPIQVLYVQSNLEPVKSPAAFNALCELLQQRSIWAVNVGETAFTPSQYDLLLTALRASSVAFAYVCDTKVSEHDQERLMEIIRHTRRSREEAPWLLGDDDVQNAIIRQCKKMFYNPMSLGLNKGFDAKGKLNSRGFFIERKKSHKIAVDIEELRKVDLEPIFNSDDPEEGESSHRLQGRKLGSRVSPEVKRFEQQANDYLDRRGLRRTACGKVKNARAANVLKSVKNCSDAMQFVTPGSRRRYGCTQRGCKGGCTKQRFHGDAAYPQQFLQDGVPLANVPLVILYACEDNTPLHVKPFDTGVEETITLNAGDLVVFRGDRKRVHNPSILYADLASLVCRRPLARRCRLRLRQPADPCLRRFAAAQTGRWGYIHGSVAVNLFCLSRLICAFS